MRRFYGTLAQNQAFFQREDRVARQPIEQRGSLWDGAPRRHGLSDSERAERLRALWSLADPCQLCPRRCGARRLSGERGACGAGPFGQVAWYGLHRGEEPPISGSRGAGNLFFVGCSLRCPFCQNHQISRPRPTDSWPVLSVGGLAEAYLDLQDRGAQVLGWVTPAQHLPAAVEALFVADEQGLDLPLVYNTGGYERLEVLRLLDGIVDVYLPDFKYGPAARFDLVRAPRDYVDVTRSALREMWRQVGDLELDSQGLARRGVCVRHLVLPGEVADTAGAIRIVRQDSGGRFSLSLLGQYLPVGQGLPAPLDRRLTPAEYREAVWLLEAAQPTQGWLQDLEAAEVFSPDFSSNDPFGSRRQC